MELELGPRQHLDRPDVLGLIEMSPQVYNTLGIEGKPQLAEKQKNRPNSLKFQLGDVQRTSERRVYALITLMSDFGGFTDGLNLLPAFLMAAYNSKMYYAAWASFFPIKNTSATKKKKKKPELLNSVQKRFQGEASLGQVLGRDDTKQLRKEARLVQVRHHAWHKALCYSRACCRRDRETRIQERTERHIMNQIDIRSLVQTRVDLSILIRLLLSRQQ